MTSQFDGRPTLERARRSSPPVGPHPTFAAHRLHQRVVRHLVRQIVGGDPKPGFCLPTEAELTQQFAVSRTVIRESIRILASKGLVTVRQGSGIWVRPPDEWKHLDTLVFFERLRASRDEGLVDQLLELRLVEPEIAALAAARRSPNDLLVLQQTTDAMRANVDHPEIYNHLDVQFHDRLLVAAGNAMMREMFRPVLDVLLHAWSAMHREHGRPSISILGHVHHDAVLDAIRAGDSQAAREAMHSLVQRFEKVIKRVFLERAGDLLSEEYSFDPSDPLRSYDSASLDPPSGPQSPNQPPVQAP